MGNIFPTHKTDTYDSYDRPNSKNPSISIPDQAKYYTMHLSNVSLVREGKVPGGAVISKI